MTQQLSQWTKLSVEDVQWYVQFCGMQAMADCMAWAQAWAELCINASWISSCFEVAYVYDNTPGMLLLESSPTSTGKYEENFKVFNDGGIITEPYWLYLEASFYPYLFFFELQLKWQESQSDTSSRFTMNKMKMKESR